MALRTKILGMVDVLMRVPPLFLLDEIRKNFQINFKNFSKLANLILNNLEFIDHCDIAYNWLSFDSLQSNTKF